MSCGERCIDGDDDGVLIPPPGPEAIRVGMAKTATQQAVMIARFMDFLRR
jgi:hypothetical protein